MPVLRFHRDPHRDWQPPPDWLRVTTIDAHTEGEPFRVVTSGFPELPGDTVLERRRAARNHHDPLRRALMWEPRGHADMYGCLLGPPVSAEADLSVLFIHNEGFSTMCGHGIIGLTTVVLETGMLPSSEPRTSLGIDTPAGLVRAQAEMEGGRVREVRFTNVPSFAAHLDATVTVPGLGEVVYDLAFGGAFYAYVEAAQLGLEVSPENTGALIEAAARIKAAVSAQGVTQHPFEADLSFLYGVIFHSAPSTPDAHLRNVCVFAEGEVDRCPTGTGVSGRLAIDHARGTLPLGEERVIESILGTRFRGQVLREERFGPHAAIVPEVTGTARITGRHEFLIDPEDPLAHGFLLR